MQAGLVERIPLAKRQVQIQGTEWCSDHGMPFELLEFARAGNLAVEGRNEIRTTPLVTCLLASKASQNAYLVVQIQPTRAKEAASMMGLSTGMVIALGVAALGLIVLVAKLFAGKPERAEKWEKAEIMKKLLALSEQEEGGRVAAPAAAKLRSSAARPAMRPAQANVKMSGKVGVPLRAKVR